MSAPTYNWVCHRCGASNAPGIDHCSSCGSFAVVTGADLDPTLTPEEAARLRKIQAERNFKIMMFFPEIIPAVIIALAAPVWAFHLATQGHIFAAAILIGGVAACAYGFFLFIRRESKWSAYGTVVSLLLLAWAVSSATTSGAH